MSGFEWSLKLDEAELRDEVRANSERFAFIVGSARSGTSILSFALNLSDDVLLLYEDEPCLNHDRPGFREWFSGKHAGFGNPRVKGTQLPQLAPAHDRLSGHHVALLERHRVVGSKYAFGAQGDGAWAAIRESYLPYHLTLFPRAAYLCLVRRPDEVLRSLDTLFPSIPMADKVECWLGSLEAAVETYFNFPRSLFLLHEHFSPQLVESCFEHLGVEPVPCTFMDVAAQASHHARGESEEPGALRRAVLAQLMTVHDRLRGLVDPDTLRLAHRERTSDFHAALELHGLIAEARRRTAGLLAEERRHALAAAVV